MTLPLARRGLILPLALLLMGQGAPDGLPRPRCDVGAGFAGLSSVVQLEPEFIKFDMALVRDIHREPTKQRLVRSMMALCRDMDVVAVAEGVETPAERDTLLELGCDVLQGYLFARPAPGFGEPVWDATR